MKKAAGILGIILSITFLILAFNTKVPDKYIKSYGTDKMQEYVGGDAYNFIIEASLRGGEIAAAQTTKAIYFGIAAILFVLSCSFFAPDSSEVLRNDLSNIRSEIANTNNSTNQLNQTLQQQKSSFENAFAGIIENQTSKLTEALQLEKSEQANS